MNRQTFEPINRKVRASYHRQQELECQRAGLMGFAEWHYDMAEDLDPTPREPISTKPANHARNSNNATRGVKATPHTTAGKGVSNGESANSVRNPHGAGRLRSGRPSLSTLSRQSRVPHGRSQGYPAMEQRARV